MRPKKAKCHCKTTFQGLRSSFPSSPSMVKSFSAASLDLLSAPAQAGPEFPLFFVPSTWLPRRVSPLRNVIRVFAYRPQAPRSIRITSLRRPSTTRSSSTTNTSAISRILTQPSRQISNACRDFLLGSDSASVTPCRQAHPLLLRQFPSSHRCRPRMPETRVVVLPRIRHARLGYVAKLLCIQRASLISFARLHLICIDSAYIPPIFVLYHSFLISNVIEEIS
jgi:hypothetical protein